ncbi:Clustered mitochondria protein [Glycine soja]|uniref:Clustered mitochondria protein n=2 Tax=Glycine soja TaxID=3848 RepID=A0A445L7V2_GLYSO|nr:Clustered mitochondria protein [Glycine soja]
MSPLWFWPPILVFQSAQHVRMSIPPFAWHPDDFLECFCFSTPTIRYFGLSIHPSISITPWQMHYHFQLEELCGASMRHLCCQLPSEDLNALVSITSDEDLAKPHRGIRSLDHRRDAVRAENALTLLYGNEPIGMQRDWNEELQSCREFPHTSPQERILRDRALYKVTSYFVDAAINGAIGVISGCIPPINPTDPECFHINITSEKHVHILCMCTTIYSLVLLLMLTLRSCQRNLWMLIQNLGAPALCKVLLIKIPFQFMEKVRFLMGGKDDGLSSEDLNGTKITQDVSPEAQLAENEQATYASANNDLKGTKAYQEADVPGLYNLAMAIIDYKGHRVSDLPGILQGDKSDSLSCTALLTMERKFAGFSFQGVRGCQKCLHLKEHLVLDGSGNLFKLATPVECKGIVGRDDRHYLLDLLRVTPRDANYTGPGSRFCILRLELITVYCQAQVAETLKSKEKNFQEADNLAIESQNGQNFSMLKKCFFAIGKLIQMGSIFS